MKKKEVRRLILEEAVEAARQGYPPDIDEVLTLLKAAGRRVVVEQDDIRNARLAQLEEMVSARFMVFTESGLCLTDITLETLFRQSLYAGGDMLDLHNFTGKLIVRRPW